jgi:hypothetical protein
MAVAHPLEKIVIMTDHEEGNIAAFEIALQVRHGVEVKADGGLVQK